MRPHGFAVVAFVVVASCSGSSQPASPLDRCSDPPDRAFAEASEIDLDLVPNPISPGAEATLTVDYLGVRADPVGGAGALWQCWAGAEWESTHQILRPFASGHGEARSIAPGTEPTVPAIGLPVPNSYEVVIPEVPTGVYRIADEIWVEGESLVGFEVVIVE